MNKEEFLIGYVLASKHRSKIISTLGEQGPKKQIDVVKQLNIECSNACGIFESLKEKGLIENLTKSETWKVISLTEKGEQINKRLAGNIGI